MSENGLISHTALGFEFILESYGVRVGIKASSRELLNKAEQTATKALLGKLEIIDFAEVDHSFSIFEDPAGTIFLDLNGERITNDSVEQRFFRFFDSFLRITIAEHARGRVFIHAGVVGWRDKAVVIPANSFRGKTTVVAELVRNGAEYYSDEYAILDSDGLVHAFPRDLTMRYFDGEVRERAVAPQSVGGKIGSKPIPIGMVLLTEYAENAVWNPQKLTVGQGIIEMIPHTIPRRFNTEFSLKVLNRAVSDAIILKSPRGEAADFAIEILNFFDNYLNLARIT
ncbi:MAG TPA: hypothetical protein VFZ23_00050 [Pyrinomonadaceae bacterium]